MHPQVPSGGDGGKESDDAPHAVVPADQAADRKHKEKAGGAKRKREARTRGFAFTLHGPDGCNDPKAFGEFAEKHLSAQWCAEPRIKSFQFQLEKAPSTGKLHLQGCFYCYRDTSLSIAHGFFGGLSAWIQPARNYKACWEYCQKDDTRIAGPWAHGPPPAQGHRTDLDDFIEDSERFKAGDVDMSYMRDAHRRIECRHLRYFDRVISRSSQPRSAKTRVVFIFGAPGTGKTTVARGIARMQYGHEPYPISLARTAGHVQFYDGYDQWSTQKAALIDEFSYHALPLREFNSLCDQGPLKVRVHGGYVEWVCELLLITSNFSFEECYPCAQLADPSALRRVDEIWRVEYHPDHPLNALATNACDCALHAVWTQIK